MNRFSRFALAAILMSGFALPSFAQGSAAATGQAITTQAPAKAKSSAKLHKVAAPAADVTKSDAKTTAKTATPAITTPAPVAGKSATTPATATPKVTTEAKPAMPAPVKSN